MNAVGFDLSELVGLIAAFLLTLSILSYILGDNFVFVPQSVFSSVCLPGSLSWLAFKTFFGQIVHPFDQKSGGSDLVSNCSDVIWYLPLYFFGTTNFCCWFS